MKDVSKIKYFDPVEKLSDILSEKTQNRDKLFFRVLASYYLTKVASMMRCDIITPDRGAIPVSMYAINLGISGSGKGMSTNIIEENVIAEFKERFLMDTFPRITEKNLDNLAIKRVNASQSTYDEERARTGAEFEALGPLMFSFDSGTTPAVKQMRHKLLMAKAGSMNMEIDEIGNNLMNNIEVLTAFLELFDVGKIKQKLIKSTKDSIRNAEIDGRTPTNMLLFGTPSKLLNGGPIEKEFYSMLDTGYARRCFFGYSRRADKDISMTPEEVYDMMTKGGSDKYLKTLSQLLRKLADPVNFGKKVRINKDVTMELIRYQQHNDRVANDLPEHQEIQKAELSHRHFKALKLAGTYAFIAQSNEITEELLYNAIKLTEDSGAAFADILTRDKDHVKLAKYIADIHSEVTQADIQDDLPFYAKSTITDKKSMLNLAIAWGYKNNIIIKKTYDNDIEFLTGESLEETDLDEIILSYSTDIAVGYKGHRVPFNELHNLTQKMGFHFINHMLVEPRRNEDNCIPGFNMAVIDVDGGIAMDTARLLLKEYEYHMYETKSSTAKDNRFRIIFPLSHIIKLDARDYKQFMLNLYDFLPFDVDRVTNQRARKWLAHKKNYVVSHGELLDGLMFIPKTKKSEDRKRVQLELHNLSSLERWFCKTTDVGNRSNNMVRYALMLVDTGLSEVDIEARLMTFNDKLSDPLEEIEIKATIMRTVAKAITKKEANDANT